MKQIILKGRIPYTEESVLARLNVMEPGILTASNVELPDGIELVDPQQYIASLTAKSNFKMEFLIAQGQNYITSG